MRNIIIENDGTIFLGKTGENLATQIQFPLVEKYRATFGEGTFQLLVKRATDEHPYAVSLTLSGDNVCWSVENTDVAIVGYGSCELQYFVGETLAKSLTWRTKVVEGMGEAGDAPEPWQSWIDDVLAAGSQAQESAQEAKESELNAKESEENALASAESAAESEETARIYAGNASASASSAYTSEQNSAESAQNALEAMISAEASEQLASASASSASSSATLAGEARVSAETARASAENSASSASSSAGQAQGYANSASGSASVATEKATQASSSASSASASATSASSSASTASTKASEASASASSASASATQASESAASASASAEQAETAKDEVEAIAENIETLLASKVDKTEYDAKTAEIDEKDASQDELIASIEAENLRQAFQIADLKNIVYDTVVEDEEHTYESLDVAPIPSYVSDGTNYHKVFDGAETMLVEIQGKTAKSFNLWDETWERGTFSTTTGEKEGNSARIRSADFVEVPVGTSIYCKTPAACTVFQYDANKVYIGYLAGTNRIVNLDSGCKYINFNCGSSGAPVTTYGNDICINISQPDTSVSPHNGDYEPHFDGLKSSVVSGVQINGANLWNEEWELGYYSSTTGEKLEHSDRIRCKNQIKVAPNTDYFFLNLVRTVCWYDKNNEFISGNLESGNMTLRSPANAYYMAFNMYPSYGTTYNNDVSIFPGSTARPYRPYKPPFNFTLPSPQELRSAGTAHDVIRIVEQGDGTWNVEKVVNVGEASGSTYELETPIVTILMTGLTEPDIATLIELNGSVEIVGNTNKQYVKPDLNTIIQAEKAVINA